MLLVAGEAAAQRSGESAAPGPATAPAAAPLSAPPSAQPNVACPDPVADTPSPSRPPCRVDVATYVGWRVYHAFCATCHAADATGSTFAPDLTDRLRRTAQRELFARLDDLHLGSRARVPLDGDDADITRYREELWAYLSARARGTLPPGAVEPLPSVRAED